MWDMPFDESLLDQSDHVVISCPDVALVDDLMGILERCGCRWLMEQRPTETNYWHNNGADSLYFVDNKKLKYGDKGSSVHSVYTKCTFCGAEQPDFCTASDDELCALLGIGGE